jgi:hypothetical protein
MGESQMRGRERVLQSLENVYRGAFGVADEAADAPAMARLDLEYQRDQLNLEVLLDIRDLLTPDQPDKTTSLLEKAQQIRRLTKLRP